MSYGKMLNSVLQQAAIYSEEEDESFEKNLLSSEGISALFGFR
jgi:hypothetical protein